MNLSTEVLHRGTSLECRILARDFLHLPEHRPVLRAVTDGTMVTSQSGEVAVFDPVIESVMTLV